MLADQVKYFSLDHAYKNPVLTFFILGLIFDHIFGIKQDTRFFPVFAFFGARRFK